MNVSKVEGKLMSEITSEIVQLSHQVSLNYSQLDDFARENRKGAGILRHDLARQENETLGISAEVSKLRRNVSAMREENLFVHQKLRIDLEEQINATALSISALEDDMIRTNDALANETRTIRSLSEKRADNLDAHIAIIYENISATSATVVENRAITDENRAIMAEHLAIMVENRANMTENRAITVKNRAIMDENRAIVDENARNIAGIELAVKEDQRRLNATQMAVEIDLGLLRNESHSHWTAVTAALRDLDENMTKNLERYQLAVSGVCPKGSFMQRIFHNGTVLCEVIQKGILSIDAGSSGVNVSLTSRRATLSLDESIWQRRLAGASECAEGSSIRGIGKDGTLRCETMPMYGLDSETLIARGFRIVCTNTVVLALPSVKYFPMER